MKELRITKKLTLRLKLDKLSFGILLLKKKRRTIDVLLLLNLGYGFMLEYLAKGFWFSFSLNQRNVKEGQRVGGIYKRYVINPER